MPHLPVWIVLVPLGAFVMVAALAWLSHRSKQLMSANERDVQLALLAKFSTAEEMSRFLATPEGRRLVDQLASPKGFDARKQVIDYLTGGLVTLGLGLALTFIGKLGLQVLAIPGIICIGLGVALLIAACFIFPIARRVGLAANRPTQP